MNINSSTLVGRSGLDYVEAENVIVDKWWIFEVVLNLNFAVTEFIWR